MPILSDISFQPKKKRRSFRSIFSKIVKKIPLVIKKQVEGIRIRCSGRLQGAEIARTECRKYGKTPCNVLHQKIDYASAEVSTRYGIVGVKVWISIQFGNALIFKVKFIKWLYKFLITSLQGTAEDRPPRYCFELSNFNLSFELLIYPMNFI